MCDKCEKAWWKKEQKIATARQKLGEVITAESAKCWETVRKYHKVENK